MGGIGHVHIEVEQQSIVMLEDRPGYGPLRTYSEQGGRQPGYPHYRAHL